MSINNFTETTRSAGSELAARASLGASEIASANTPNALVALFTVVIPTFFSRMVDLIAAPFRYPEMQWVVLPLLVSFVLLEIYFFRNTNEELGWNSVLANGIVLIFIGIDLTRTLFNRISPFEVFKTLIEMSRTGEGVSGVMVPLFLLAYGLSLVIIAFLHAVPRFLAYKLASHAPVTFVSYIAAVAVYSNRAGDALPLDWYTVSAGAVLFTVLVAIIFFLQRSPGVRAFQTIRGGGY